MDAELRARADGWAFVNDPLSNVTIDITKQCVNVSLSRDGGAEVGPAACKQAARPRPTMLGSQTWPPHRI